MNYYLLFKNNLLFKFFIYKMKDILEQVRDEDGKLKDKYEGRQRVYLYMKIFYGFFITWMGYNILMSDYLNEKNQKYLKETLISIKTKIDNYNPNLLSNEKLIKFFNYDTLINKTYEITLIFCYLFIVGGFLVSIGYKLGKIIVFITLFLNIILVHNIHYFEGEKLKVNVFKYWSLLGGAFYL